MVEMTLQDRWDYVVSACKEGYIIRQWIIEFSEGTRVYISTLKDKNIGVYLDEIQDALNS